MMDERGLVAQLKSQWTILEMVERCGLEEGRKGLKFLAPCHADTSPSAHLYVDQDRWQCFVCDVGGDQLDLYAAVQGVALVDAIRMLATEHGLDWKAELAPPKPRQPSPSEQLLRLSAQAHLEVLRTLQHDYSDVVGREAWVSLVEAAFYHYDEIMRRHRNRDLKPETAIVLVLTWWRWMTGKQPYKEDMLTLFSVIGDDRFWRAVTKQDHHGHVHVDFDPPPVPARRRPSLAGRRAP